MSDDSFIREVEEELRSDRLKSIWKRYGRLIIAVAIVLVLVTAGYRYWLYYKSEQASRSGGVFLEAIELSEKDDNPAAIEKLEQLAEQGSGEYPALARLRLAAEYARAGDAQEAIKAFDELANETGFDETLRRVSRLRAGLLLVDHGTYDQVADRLEQLAGDENSFRHSAREGLGLAAYKNGQDEIARDWLQKLLDDTAAPSGIRTRANIILELIAGRSAAPEEAN